MSAPREVAAGRQEPGLLGALVLGAFGVEVLTVVASAGALPRDGAVWALVAALPLLAIAVLLLGRRRRARDPRLASILGAHTLVGTSILVCFGASSLQADPRAEVAGLAAAGATAIVAAAWAAREGFRALPEGAASRALGPALLLAASALLARQALDLRPVLLQRVTLEAVDALSHLVFADVSCDLEQGTVGTQGFRVRVTPACSGVEGMSLGLVLVVPYLILSRRRLRFPRALLLPPLLVLSLAVVNVARIVLLLFVGRTAPREALNAFHSSIGWLLFALSIALFIPFWERVLRLRPEDAPHAEGAAPDPRAYLVPFIVSSGVALAASLLREPSWLSLLRYPAGVAALLLLPVPASERRAPLAAPALVGAGVAALYLAVPATAGTTPSLVEGFVGGIVAPAGSLIAAIGYALVTPVVEELAFRGYLMRRLVGRPVSEVRYEEVGVLAISLSSLAFGVLHPTWWLGTLAGLAFGLSARRLGGLGAAVTSHVAANALIAMVALSIGRPELLR